MTLGLHDAGDDPDPSAPGRGGLGAGWGRATAAQEGPYRAAQEGPPADRVRHWWRCTGGGAHSHAWGACMCDKLRQWRRQGVPGFPSRCVAAHTRTTALLAPCAALPQPEPRRDWPWRCQPRCHATPDCVWRVVRRCCGGWWSLGMETARQPVGPPPLARSPARQTGRWPSSHGMYPARAASVTSAARQRTGRGQGVLMMPGGPRWACVHTPPLSPQTTSCTTSSPQHQGRR
jgi:hypothetical protein